MGVGTVLGMMLLAAGTPDLPGRADAPAPRNKLSILSMPAALQMGARWGIVTSVHRTPERNRIVGGAPNSFHLRGRAIDIARRPGVRHAEIDAAFRRAGYVLLESLDEGDHSHFAFGLPGETPRTAPAAAKVQLAVVAKPAAPACPVEDPAARRRPDRSDGCGGEDAPASRLRPLETAP
jgi:hypothetical protein